MFTEGQFIGPYELVRKLGAGAFGEVWLARQSDLGVERALKIPTDRDYVKQLRQEGRIQFDLRHPNIVETQDLNTHSEPPYFAMEYVEGEDLRKLLNERGKLPVAEALDILRQILEGLGAAHAQGVLHRDLKPENILITRDGMAKIADFGLGRVQATIAQSLILSGSMVSVERKSVSGTFEYMSPEQRRGETADPRDDLYAAGLIGCELLTGTQPAGAGVAALFRRANLATPLAELFEKALEERGFCFHTADEMLSQVRSVLAGAGQGPPPLSAAQVYKGPPPLPAPQVHPTWPLNRQEARRGLLRCPNCGRDVSPSAEACPKCGCPIRQLTAPKQAGGTFCRWCNAYVTPVVTCVGGGSCSFGKRETWKCPTCKRVLYRSGCFVATSTYGDEDFVEVQFLRAFRDEIMSRSELGRVLIWVYCKFGPYAALVVERVPLLRPLCRKVLDKIVDTIERSTHLKRSNFRGENSGKQSDRRGPTGR